MTLIPFVTADDRIVRVWHRDAPPVTGDRAVLKLHTAKAIFVVADYQAVVRRRHADTVHAVRHDAVLDAPVFNAVLRVAEREPLIVS